MQKSELTGPRRLIAEKIQAPARQFGSWCQLCSYSMSVGQTYGGYRKAGEGQGIRYDETR